MTDQAAEDIENSAWGAGCDLWVIAEPRSSSWARKIDWYLNFQLMKASLHKRQELPRELRELARDVEFELPDIADRTSGDEQAPLMVVSSQLLPTAMVVMIPSTTESGTWVEAVTNVVKSILPQTGRVRVFLPDTWKGEGKRLSFPRDGTAVYEVIEQSKG